MIRVLHIIDSLVSGGKERQFLELLKGLKSEPGITCGAIVMSDVIEYEGLHELGIQVTVLPRRTRYDVSMVARLRAAMRGFRPDIVQSWNSMCSVYAAPLAKLLGARFIDGFVRAAAANITWRDPDFFRSRFTLPLTDKVVSNSIAGLTAYRIPALKGLWIHNGFDPTRLAHLSPPAEIRESLGIETDHVVGMVASFSRLKDHETFFEMAQRLAVRRDDTTFVALGDGEKLAAYRARFPPDRFPRFVLPGRRADVESIVNVFTLGVLTSEARVAGEGIANAIMECMALGKPVVATACGGNGELILEGQNGFLVADRDADMLTNRVSRLLDDPVMAHDMGEAGRRRIGDEFSLARMTQAYRDLYRAVLNAN